MGNSKIWTIIKREYLSKISTKGFIISTIIAPVAMILLISVPILITYFSMSSESNMKLKITVVDHTGFGIGKEIIDSSPDEYKIFDISSISGINSFDKIEENLKEEILKGEIGGALIIYSNSITNGKVKILTGETTGLKYITDIKDKVNSILKARRLSEAGISQETIDLVNASLQFETIKVTPKGTSKDNSEVLSFLGYFLGFIMYGLMFIYGSQVMQGVLEEKSNRIIEILMSSARPFQIMFGKVVGIGAVGLTQVVFWLVILAGLLLVAGTFLGPDAFVAGSLLNSANIDEGMMQAMKEIEIPNISPWIFIAFGFYFIAGYFLYATLFAAVGAAIDQIQDANSLSAPLTILIIIPILCIPNVMLNPEGTFATILSLVPFFGPILMIARVAAITVPIWQILLSIILLIGTFIICLKFAAKIYRIGMLSYGKKPTLKELAKWAISD